MKQNKNIKAWAGIVGGKIHSTLEYYGDRARMPAIYYSRKQAKKLYEEVIPVTITPTKKKR